MKTGNWKKLIIFAVKNTYAIGVSWIPIALAFGLIVRNSGFNALWAAASCALCPFGTLQMMAFSFAASGVAWITMLITSVAVSCRHIFYGLSFVEKFRFFSASKHYMIYMLCDELYSVYCSMEIPEDLDEQQAHIAIAAVMQSYWIILTTLATLIGTLIPFDLTGVDFALTALFMVIFIEMLLSGKTKIPAAMGLVSGLVCLLVFGAENFLLPALALVSIALIFLKKQLEHSQEGGAEL